MCSVSKGECYGAAEPHPGRSSLRIQRGREVNEGDFPILEQQREAKIYTHVWNLGLISRRLGGGKIRINVARTGHT